MHFTSHFHGSVDYCKNVVQKGFHVSQIYLYHGFLFLPSSEQPSLYRRDGEQWRHLSANRKLDTEGATNSGSSCISGGLECLFCCFSTLIVSSELSLREIDLFRLQ